MKKLISSIMLALIALVAQAQYLRLSSGKLN